MTSTRRVGQLSDYSITSYPLFGTLVTPNDGADLATPGTIRVNGAGNVVVIPYGNTASITLTLAAGEFVPCIVKRVLATGTTATSIHVFY